MIVSLITILIAVASVVVVGALKSQKLKLVKIVLKQEERLKKEQEEEEAATKEVSEESPIIADERPNPDEPIAEPNTEGPIADADPNATPVDEAVKPVVKKGDFIENQELTFFPIVSNGSLLAGFVERQLPNAEEPNLVNPTAEGMITKLVQFTAAINGVFSVQRTIDPIITRILPESIQRFNFTIDLFERQFKFNCKEHLSFVFAIVFAFCYSNYSNWLIINIFLIVVAINAIEYCQLSNIQDAGRLLAFGLIAENLDKIGLGFLKATLKVKLTLPWLMMKPDFAGQLMEVDEKSGLEVQQLVPFVGIGDIVMPGLGLAFLYRFDQTFKTSYFRTALITYLISMSMSLYIQMFHDVNFPPRHLINPCLILIVLSKALINKQYNHLVNYKESYDQATKEE